jgi:hypothetical protein
MGLLRRRDSTRGKGATPRLVPVPAMSELPTPKLQSPARYLGTLTDSGEPVTGQSLAAKSSSRLHLSTEGLDVVRMAGSFRIPTESLRGALTDTDFHGKPVESLLVVRWEHGEHQWRTGFRLEAGRKMKGEPARPPNPAQWVRTISKMSRTSAGGR